MLAWRSWRTNKRTNEQTRSDYTQETLCPLWPCAEPNYLRDSFWISSPTHTWNYPSLQPLFRHKTHCFMRPSVCSTRGPITATQRGLKGVSLNATMAYGVSIWEKSRYCHGFDELYQISINLFHREASENLNAAETAAICYPCGLKRQASLVYNGVAARR
jgi:hypothetical protein